MNIQPHFIIMCREAFLAAGTNNLNLINVFTKINADEFPFMYTRFALVVNFDIDMGGNHILHTDVLDSSGKQIARTDLPVTTHAGNWQVIANFEQMQFSAPGTYSFLLSLDGVSLGSRTLEVKPIFSPSSVHKTAIA
ncbi:MAG: hypothetical protein AAB910_00100 [Patescibacteria group bacterium]